MFALCSVNLPPFSDLFTSTRQLGAVLPQSARPGQCQPNPAADHAAARYARQQPSPLAREEQPRATGQQRVDRIGDRAGDHESRAEQRHLRDMVLAQVHELRNERAKEHQHFGI